MSSAHLDHISVRGFKSIASLDRLDLRNINILIGPNGSGKSNFIGVFAFLRAIREGQLAEYTVRAGGADKILHYGSKVTNEIRIQLSFRGGINGYDLTLQATQDDALFPTSETAYFQGQGYNKPYDKYLSPAERGREAGISKPFTSGIEGWVRERMGGWRIYHVHDTSASSPMRKTAKINDNGFLRRDGSNLPAFLYLLQQKYEPSYQLIRRTIQRVAPFFDDFNLRPGQLNPDDIRLEWKHKNSDMYFDAASLSDGTMRFIVLATLFLQPNQFLPSVVLVDEPELGLHPFAIEVLASLVRHASASTQVIVSTQSSLLLDHFEPADVLVANRVDRGTVIARLEPELLSRWKGEYSLGQLWEKNEIAGRPATEA